MSRPRPRADRPARRGASPLSATPPTLRPASGRTGLLLVMTLLGAAFLVLVSGTDAGAQDGGEVGSWDATSHRGDGDAGSGDAGHDRAGSGETSWAGSGDPGRGGSDHRDGTGRPTDHDGGRMDWPGRDGDAIEDHGAPSHGDRGRPDDGSRRAPDRNEHDDPADGTAGSDDFTQDAAPHAHHEPPPAAAPVAAPTSPQVTAPADARSDATAAVTTAPAELHAPPASPEVSPTASVTERGPGDSNPRPIEHLSWPSTPSPDGELHAGPTVPPIVAAVLFLREGTPPAPHTKVTIEEQAPTLPLFYVSTRIPG